MLGAVAAVVVGSQAVWAVTVAVVVVWCVVWWCGGGVSSKLGVRSRRSYGDVVVQQALH